MFFGVHTKRSCAFFMKTADNAVFILLYICGTRASCPFQVATGGSRAMTLLRTGMLLFDRYAGLYQQSIS